MQMLEHNRGTWLAAIGTRGLGRDPEVEAILDEARERAVDRLIEALQTYEAATAPPELRATIRAYSGFAEAASVEWLERGRLTREQLQTLLVQGFLSIVRDVLPRSNEQGASSEQQDVRHRCRHDEVREARREGGGLPGDGQGVGTKALQDAGVAFDQIEQAYAGFIYGESSYGQRAMYELGMTGIPMINVNNNCSTGSSALNLARTRSRAASPTARSRSASRRCSGVRSGRSTRTASRRSRSTSSACSRSARDKPFPPQMFGAAGLEHNERYGSKPEHFAKIGEKNHRHSANNPYAQFQTEYKLDEIKRADDPRAADQAAVLPTWDGSGAAIVASEAFVEKHGLGDQAIEITGQAMVTDMRSTFDTKSAINLVGADMSRKAAEKVYAQSQADPGRVDVVELHDCFAPTSCSPTRRSVWPRRARRTSSSEQRHDLRRSTGW